MADETDAMDQGEHILLNDDLNPPYHCSCGKSFAAYLGDDGWFRHIGETE